MIEPLKIEVQGGTALRIEWQDGRVDTISAAQLRDSCGCASCQNAPVPLPPADPETCRVASIGFIGAYAVNVVFAPDGHATGIYSFPMLREIGARS